MYHVAYGHSMELQTDFIKNIPGRLWPQ